MKLSIPTREELAVHRDRLKTLITRLRTQFAHLVLIPDLSGDPGHDLRQQVFRDGALTPGYILMCALSAGIAALGLLQSSVAVVIGAMLISPLMTPIVALGFGFASLDGARIKDAARVVAYGAAIGMLTAILLTWISPIRNATPEIIARTQPTLLDLAVALFSGLAGGYSIVQQKGATAIGVAIATALMPPLAVVGYGIGTARLDFAGGAFLLFLTNLAAIAFAIALIARLSGAARPLHKVEFTWRHIAGGLTAFAILATPLAITLLRISKEAGARSTTMQVLTTTLGIEEHDVAQLDVKWSVTGQPKIDALVVTSGFRSGAEADVSKKLTEIFGTRPELNLQQIVAADIQSQTRAIVNAAMERTAAGINSDVPPYDRIRSGIGIPILSVWTNRAERTVNIVPASAPGWTLTDYRLLEGKANALATGWRIRVEPPVPSNIPLRLGPDGAIADLPDIIWAIQAWGLDHVRAIIIPRNRDEEWQAAIGAMEAEFAHANIMLELSVENGRNGESEISIFATPPSLENISGGQNGPAFPSARATR